VFQPDGSTDVVGPDGTVSHELPPAPDGSNTLVGSDGTTATTDAQGNSTVHQPNGTVTNYGPDGDLQATTSSNGTVSVYNSDGSVDVYNPDGTLGSHQLPPAPDGSRTSVLPNGTTDTVSGDGTDTMTLPGGATATTTSDGTVVTLPDGSSEIYPSHQPAPVPIAPSETSEAPPTYGPQPVPKTPPAGTGPQPLPMPVPIHAGPTPLIDVPEPPPPAASPPWDPVPPPPPAPGLTGTAMNSGSTPLVPTPDPSGHMNAGPPLTGGAGPMPGPGGTTITSANGQIVVTSPQGIPTTAVQTGGGGYQAGLSDGNLLTVKPDGSASIQLPDGSTQTWDAHGRYAGTLPPSNTYAQQGANLNAPNPTHDVQVPMTGGGFRIDHPDGSSDIHWPDGSIVHVAPNQQQWYQVRGPYGASR
jgi:hypothetical protein